MALKLYDATPGQDEYQKAGFGAVLITVSVLCVVLGLGSINKQNTSEACCTSCKSYSGCVAWNFNKDSDSEGHGDCWLQRTIGKPQASSTFDSGILRVKLFALAFDNKCSSLVSDLNNNLYLNDESPYELEKCYQLCKVYFTNDNVGNISIAVNKEDGKCVCTDLSCSIKDSDSKYRTFKKNLEKNSRAMIVATCTNTINDEGSFVDNILVDGPNNDAQMELVKTYVVSDSSITYDVVTEHTITVPTPSSYTENVPSPSSVTNMVPSPSGNETVSVEEISTVQQTVSVIRSRTIQVPTPSQYTTEYKKTPNSRRLQIWKLVGGLDDGTHEIKVTLKSGTNNAAVDSVSVLGFTLENVKSFSSMDGVVATGNSTTSTLASTAPSNSGNDASDNPIFFDFACFDSPALTDANVNFASIDQSYQLSLNTGLASSYKRVSQSGAINFNWNRGTSVNGNYTHTMIGFPTAKPNLVDQATITAVSSQMKTKGYSNIEIDLPTTYPNIPAVGYTNDNSLEYLPIWTTDLNVILGYRVDFKKQTDTSYTLGVKYGYKLASIPDKLYIEKVLPGTAYVVRIVYRTGVGYGDLSIDKTVTTGIIDIVQNHSNFVATRVNATTCTLTWDSPLNLQQFHHVIVKTNKLSSDNALTNDGEMKIETITNVPRKLHTESNTHSGLTWVFDLPCAFPYTDAAGYTWNTCLHDSSENYGMCTMAIKKMGYCRECQDQTCSSFLSGCYDGIYGAEDQTTSKLLAGRSLLQWQYFGYNNFADYCTNWGRNCYCGSSHITCDSNNDATCKNSNCGHIGYPFHTTPGQTGYMKIPGTCKENDGSTSTTNNPPYVLDELCSDAQDLKLTAHTLAGCNKSVTYNVNGLVGNVFYEFSTAYVNEKGVGSELLSRCPPYDTIVAAPSNVGQDSLNLTFPIPTVNSTISAIQLFKRVVKPLTYNIEMDLIASPPSNGSDGGQFRLIIDDEYTECINWDDSSDDVRQKLEKTVKAVNVKINSTSTNSKSWKIKFMDKLKSRKVTVKSMYQPNEKQRKYVVVNGKNRSYTLWRLTNVSDPAPLVFYFHEGGGNVDECEREYWVSQSAFRQSHIVCMESLETAPAHFFEWRDFTVEYRKEKVKSWRIPHILNGIASVSGLSGNFIQENKCNLTVNDDLAYMNETYHALLAFGTNYVNIDSTKIHVLGKGEGADMALYTSQCMRNLITSVGMLSSGLSKITLRNNGWECSSYKKNTQSLPGCAGGGGQTKSTHGGYLGCFKVDTGTGLDLNIYTSVTDVTVSKCRTACAAIGETYFALLNGSTCYCGNNYGSYGKANETDCSAVPCDGDISSTGCGGVKVVSVYSTSFTSYNTDTVQTLYYPSSIIKNDNQQICTFNADGTGDTVVPKEAVTELFDTAKSAGQKLLKYKMLECVGHQYDPAYNKEMWACLNGEALVDVGQSEQTITVSSDGESTSGGGSNEGEGSGTKETYTNTIDIVLSNAEKPSCYFNNSVPVACRGFPIESVTTASNIENNDHLKLNKEQDGIEVEPFSSHLEFTHPISIFSNQPGTTTNSLQIQRLTGATVYQFMLNITNSITHHTTDFVETLAASTPGKFPNNNGPLRNACPASMQSCGGSSNDECDQSGGSTCDLNTEIKYCKDSGLSISCLSNGPSFCDISWYKPDDNNGAIITKYDVFYCKCTSSSSCDSDECKSATTIEAMNDAKWFPVPVSDVQYHFFHVDDNSQGLKKSYASINNLEPNTNYRFLISAVNSVGNNRKLGHANMLPCLTRDATTPGLVDYINLVSVAADTITISWRLNITGGAGRVNFNVLKVDCATVCNGENDLPPESVNISSVYTYTFSGLKASSMYAFKIRGNNTVGVGNYNEYFNVTTGVPSIANPPTQVTKLNVTESIAYISWVAPVKKGGNTITGYKIEIQQLDGNNTSLDWETNVDNTGSSSTIYQITNLLAGKKYRARVSTINAIGVSVASQVSDTILNDGGRISDKIASSPTIIRQSTAEISLKWSLPKSHGGYTIDGYKIMYTTMIRGSSNNTEFQILVNNTNTTERVYNMLANIIPGNKYAFKIAAWNVIGLSEFSPVSAFTQCLSESPAPILVQPTAASVNPTRLVLSWTPPTYDGGANIVGYVILMRENSVGSFKILIDDTKTNETSMNIGNLLPGRLYEFRIKSINEVNGKRFISPSSLTSGKAESKASFKVKLYGSETNATFHTTKQNNFTTVISYALNVPKEVVVIETILSISDSSNSGSRRLLQANTGIEIQFSIVNITSSDAIDATTNFNQQLNNTILTQLQTVGIAVNTVESTEAPSTIIVPSDPITAEATAPLQLKTSPIVNSIAGTTISLAWPQSSFEESGGSVITSYRIRSYTSAPAQQKISLYLDESLGGVEKMDGEYRMTYNNQTSSCLKWNSSASVLKEAFEKITYTADSSNSNNDDSSSSSMNISGTSNVSVSVTRSTGNGVKNIKYAWTVTFIAPEGPVEPIQITSDNCGQLLLGATVNVSNYINGVLPRNNVTTIEVLFTPDASLTYDLVGLLGGRYYSFQVAPINKIGIGPYSESSNPALTGPPSIPSSINTKPVVVEVTESTIKISWVQPVSYGIDIIGYKVTMQATTPEIQVLSFYSNDPIPSGTNTTKITFDGKNTYCIPWDASTNDIEDALAAAAIHVNTVTRSPSGSNGYRWTIMFPYSYGDVNPIGYSTCGNNVPIYGGGEQLRLDQISHGVSATWKTLSYNTESNETVWTARELNSSAKHIFQVFAINEAGISPSGTLSDPIYTLGRKNCVLSDWSQWSTCYVVQEDVYNCGEIVIGSKGDGSNDMLGRRACSAVDVSLLEEGTVSETKEKNTYLFQNRTRVVLEKQRNNGLGCGNGISLTEVQPCCDTSRKNVVGAWGGISRTCNGSHWN
eukprot:g2481.t1